MSAGRGHQRRCTTCGIRAVAFPQPHITVCFTCWPGGPVAPPPCLRCGSRFEYFVAGLCHRCHRDGHPGVDSCRNCLAWGATRTHKWLCLGCNSWCRKYTISDDCSVCGRQSVLDHSRVCRLCRKQGALWRQPREKLDLVAANRHGQQLFLADMFVRRDKTQPQHPPVEHPPPPLRAMACHQLTLFEARRDLSQRGHRLGGLAERADPAMFALLEPIIGQHAAARGWNHHLIWRVRLGVQIMLGFQDTPGSTITASDAAALTGTEVPVVHVLEVFEHAGLLDDDRISAVQARLDRKLAELPQPMAGEVQQWATIMLNGSTIPPRRLPRSPITVGLQLGWMLPALHRWAEQGHTSLREISRTDVEAVLPSSGNPRALMGQGLKSLFRVLKGAKITFTDPARWVPTGHTQPKQPLPLDPAAIRDALDSPDIAQALIIALVAFHGLRNGQLRDLHLTDIHDGYLHIGDRTVPLAAPVRTRLSAYLDLRNKTWPETANPHLFVNYRTAYQFGPVGHRWVKLKVDIPGGVQALREDRILHEAHATGGDVRQICDLFGLSVQAATRYTATLDHPALIAADP
ncbi:hypothetical protein [Microbispora hainanensis]|uniref:hypothetical protein n=1 Tax=Microbispora hainanensis TaxID=568844 RepID=UPI001ABFF72F|nr:hypothetical protein [Microbispora hainanensis]